MEKLCVGCSEKRRAPFKATIFTSNGAPVSLHLCKVHDVELFKIGQLRFVEKYQIPLKSGDILDNVLDRQSHEVFADFAES